MPTETNTDTTSPWTLADLGWRPDWQQQLTLEEFDSTRPARVTNLERSHVRLATEAGETTLPLQGRWASLSGEERLAVGDWLLLDANGQQIKRRLDRASLLQRRAAGPVPELQPMAANIDTLFVVSSCNQDFNPSRIERYLAVALEAGTTPVLVLTKMDLCPDPQALAVAARALHQNLLVETVNALDPASVAPLAGWCRAGQTVALVGSSGVGKSTLLNTLMGANVRDTGGIRDQDAHGRHTTTNRALFRLPDGGLVLDSPGMRELQISDVRDGLHALFDDIDALAEHCRFGDCGHDQEPGCAVQAALADGRLEPRRLDNYRKLLREDQRNTQSVAERHQQVRQFSRMVRSANAVRDKRRQ